MRHRGIYITTLLMSLLFGYAKTTNAELSIGLGYPYLSLRFTPDILKYVGLEAKYAFGENLNVIGGRGYFIFVSESRVKLYSGYEMGYIQINDPELTGSGREYGVFGGLQVIISPQVNINLDISPTMIELNSQNIGVNGVEWIVNAAIYLNVF